MEQFCFIQGLPSTNGHHEQYYTGPLQRSIVSEGSAFYLAFLPLSALVVVPTPTSAGVALTSLKWTAQHIGMHGPAVSTSPIF